MKGSQLICAADMPTLEQMQEIGAAAELLLEAMAKAGRREVRPGDWYNLRVSIRKNPDGTTLLGDLAIDARPW